MIRNEIRRALVNKLLGQSLVIEIKQNLGAGTVEFIDLERRLTYGKWGVESFSNTEIKIRR